MHEWKAGEAEVQVVTKSGVCCLHRHVDSAAINYTTITLPCNHCNLCLQMPVYSFYFIFFFYSSFYISLLFILLPLYLSVLNSVIVLL